MRALAYLFAPLSDLADRREIEVELGKGPLSSLQGRRTVIRI